MEQSPSPEADSYSASKKQYNAKVLVLTQISLVHTLYTSFKIRFNILKPTGHVMHHQFNIQQLYALPTLYLCALYLCENKQRFVPLTP
jgi:hypothetical protein